MDLPLSLEKGIFVKEWDELRQCITMILKSHEKEFLQDPTMGKRFSIHTDQGPNYSSVQEALSDIPYLNVVEVSGEPEDCKIKVEYKGNAKEFVFDITKLENEQK